MSRYPKAASTVCIGVYPLGFRPLNLGPLTMPISLAMSSISLRVTARAARAPRSFLVSDPSRSRACAIAVRPSLVLGPLLLPPWNWHFEERLVRRAGRLHCRWVRFDFAVHRRHRMRPPAVRSQIAGSPPPERTLPAVFNDLFLLRVVLMAFPNSAAHLLFLKFGRETARQAAARSISYREPGCRVRASVRRKWKLPNCLPDCGLNKRPEELAATHLLRSKPLRKTRRRPPVHRQP